MTSATLDPRLNAYRDDLAAESLKGRVTAARFTAGAPRRVIESMAPLRRRSSADAGLETEVLFGEQVTMFDDVEGWAWVQLKRDGYVGYLSSAMLSDNVIQPTHRVSAVGTFVYPEPDIKAPPLMALAMNARLCIVEEGERFLELADGGFVVARHVAERGRYALDFVEIAERFIGTPYLWGGRTRMGIDCSGLLQVALEAAGLSAPRDSDMQQAELGDDVLVPADLDGLRRGDLVFWPGHVGVMTDAVFMLHANAHHMATAIEPLSEAVARMAGSSPHPAAVKRLPDAGRGASRGAQTFGQ